MIVGLRYFLGIGLIIIVSNLSIAQGQHKLVVEAANEFIQSLSDQQKAKCIFQFEDMERTNWHFTVKDRIGLAWEDLNTAQRVLGNQLISTGVSPMALKTAESIMAHEEILRVLEKRPEGDRIRHPELYYFSFFGKPDNQEIWGWRFEGHHLSLNFTLIDGQQIVTPAFYGANPAKVLSGPQKGLRILKAEEDIARELAQSLSEDAKKVVVSDIAPPELLDAASSKVSKKHMAEGIAASEFKPSQKALFENLLNTYFSKLTEEDQAVYNENLLKQGFDQIYFSWRGGLEVGEKHYYRIQGPELWIEYDCTQNDGNHIHCIFRGIHNDFGYNLLEDHYEKEHRN